MIRAREAASAVVLTLVWCGTAVAAGPARPDTPAGSVAADPADAGQPVDTNRMVSVKPDGSPTNEFSYQPSVSADGRYVVFASDDKLAPGLKYHQKTTHVFRYDRKTGEMAAVDVKPNGNPGNARSEVMAPAISADGRYIAFSSFATNLVRDDYEPYLNVFVRDMVEGTTVLVSQSDRGRAGDRDSQDATLSEDGSVVVFTSVAKKLVPEVEHREHHIYRRDLVAGTIALISKTPTGVPGLGPSERATVSGDGTQIAYRTEAPDIVPNDAGEYVIVHHDVTTGMSTLVSVAPDGAPPNGPSYYSYLSADGSTVAYQSAATNLVTDENIGVYYQIYCYRLDTQQTELVSRSRSRKPTNESSYEVSVSRDGALIAYSTYAGNILGHDTNGVSDIVLYDRATQSSRAVSHAPAGRIGNEVSSSPAISADGTLVAYHSKATNLVKPPLKKGNVYRVYAYRVY